MLTRVELRGRRALAAPQGREGSSEQPKFVGKSGTAEARDLVKRLMRVKRVHAAMQQDLLESVTRLDSAAPPAHS